MDTLRRSIVIPKGRWEWFGNIMKIVHENQSDALTTGCNQMQGMEGHWLHAPTHVSYHDCLIETRKIFDSRIFDPCIPSCSILHSFSADLVSPTVLVFEWSFHPFIQPVIRHLNPTCLGRLFVSSFIHSSFPLFRLLVFFCQNTFHLSRNLCLGLSYTNSNTIYSLARLSPDRKWIHLEPARLANSESLTKDDDDDHNNGKCRCEQKGKKINSTSLGNTILGPALSSPLLPFSCCTINTSFTIISSRITRICNKTKLTERRNDEKPDNLRSLQTKSISSSSRRSIKNLLAPFSNCSPLHFLLQYSIYLYSVFYVA